MAVDVDVAGLHWAEADTLMRQLRERLRNDQTWRLGGVRVRSIFEKWHKAGVEHLGRQPRAVMDFGCGIFHPYANLLLFWLNGSDRGVAVELDKRIVKTRAADATLELIHELSLSPELYGEPQLEKLRHVDLRALHEGRLYDGMKQAPLTHYVGDVRTLEHGDFDFVFSQAVLEHVDEVESVFQALYDRTAPGGVHTHVVDFRDHRAYADPKRTTWDFLTEEKPDGPFCNRLRVSHILAAFEKAGFEIVASAGERKELPREVREKLLPRFTAMSEEDLETQDSQIVLRRPG